MAKKSSGGTKNGGSASADKIPDALREAGRPAADLARNPVARGMLIATLATAAAALATNKNIRESAKKNARKAQSAAEAAADAAADSANRIGAAMIDAATDAVRRMMGDMERAPAAAAPSAPSARPSKTSGG